MGFEGFSGPQGINTVGGSFRLSSGQFLAPDGTAAAPSYSFTNATNYGITFAAGEVDICVAGGAIGSFRANGLYILSNSGFFGLGASGDVLLYREAAATLQMGSDVNGAAVAQTFKAHDGITGTDVAGASFTWAPGRGTGAGTGASLIFSTATTLATGTTAQTLVARLTLSQGVVTTDAATLTFADKLDMIFSGTTGTKIGGTGAKLGFYGTTPTALLTGVAVTAGGIHAALVTLGLITA